MLILKELIKGEQLAEIRTRFEALRFVDGRETAGPLAKEVKNNRQAARDDAGSEELGALIRHLLVTTPQFTTFAWPVRFSRTLFSRYGAGDDYGFHVDEPFMGDDRNLRTDLSYTLFLSDPDSYEGGALALNEPSNARGVKLPAGSVVVYETNPIHRVEPVTSGERWAAVGWIQSRVRRPDQREVLFDLERLRSGAQGPTQLLLQKTVANLLRMWGE